MASVSMAIGRLKVMKIMCVLLRTLRICASTHAQPNYKLLEVGRVNRLLPGHSDLCSSQPGLCGSAVYDFDLHDLGKRI